MRVAIHECRVEPHHAQQVDDPWRARVSVGEVVGPEGLGQYFADRLAWVERGIRVLEDHLEAPSLAPQRGAAQG